MSGLTYSLLANYPYSALADRQSIQRGKAYYQEDRVFNIDLVGETRAVCSVEGDTGEYTVEIQVDSRTGRLDFECDCPYAESHFCKHMVAAGLALADLLQEDDAIDDDADEDEDEDDDIIDLSGSPTPSRAPKPPVSAPPPVNRGWTDQLNRVMRELPRPAGPGGNTQLYAAFVILHRLEHYYYTSYTFTPGLVKAKYWYVLDALKASDRDIINDLLDKNHDWIKYYEDLTARVTPHGCLNLPPEAVQTLEMLGQYARYYGTPTTFANYIETLVHYGVPVFLANPAKQTVQGQLTILTDPADLQIHLSRSRENLVLQAGVKGETKPVGGKPELISSNPPWLLVNTTLIRLRHANDFSLLSSFPIIIPESDADFFRERHLPQLLQALPIAGDLLQWHDAEPSPPVPRLYLHDDRESRLRAELRFGYGEYEVLPARNVQPDSVELIPGSWDVVRIQRQADREQDFYNLLADPLYRLKRAGSSQPYGTFDLRARAHPFDFLMYSIPKLTEAGFEIYGEESLKAGRINRATPSLRINITSGIDWFDLHAAVQFGDQEVAFQDVRRALKRGERYIKLADGSIGQLPEEWLDRYRHLWNLASETEDGYRVSDFHLSLLDDMLEDGVANQPPPDLIQRRERLRGFSEIQSRPLPAGFTGELRPYQKHGFDWLHFLREYRFGGILADDMGLGKTVQMLAYLLSLKENAPEPSHPVSLLVVPKTLIANWQREAEKFAPGLRFLEYLGNFRQKNTAIFNDYDIILTTYGTMLRDIELLRGYSFDHVILDESQAIKNPLSKSARAARLLNAAHRMVMTGTPVENNTFELWSQFAFTNPGLLGSLDGFKSAFANPIESGQDEDAAATLRKLTYPFILRRTKEQVAPELPPRTERTLYTDMDTAQKKLYQQTKERYRAELLGLIDQTGLEDARFKILEGLLRLRQIAIHPGLVEPTYHGEVPKFEVLLETLDTLQGEKHKALIFSQFVEVLQRVRRELDARKIPYEYLDGRTRDRQARVDSFQCDPSISFFLISLKAGGVGLNLTAADYVIHLDPWWNPAVEMQASDRAHRIGQDKPVFIYKIITRGTVEEKILQLQEKKRALVQNLIATEASFFKSLTRDDVKMLFE